MRSPRLALVYLLLATSLAACAAPAAESRERWRTSPVAHAQEPTRFAGLLARASGASPMSVHEGGALLAAPARHAHR